jgi:hypothetical protein
MDDGQKELDDDYVVVDGVDDDDASDDDKLNEVPEHQVS